MKQTVILMAVLSGLWLLPACFSCEYVFVNHEKSWPEAQEYCRRMYTDLATVLNEEDLAKMEEIRAGRNVWIGLRADLDAWKWSLDDPDYYGEGETEFRNWFSVDEKWTDGYEACVALLFTGEWVDHICNKNFTFFCYTDSTEASSPIIFVDVKKSWKEAQQYCREHYTDLASVRNQAENEYLIKIKTAPYVWIGLYRNSWTWSDGSAHSFGNWAANAPFSTESALCVASGSDRWINTDCSLMRPFICYHEPNKERKVVKVVLKKNDPSVDMEALKEDMLAKLNQKLEEHGLSGSLTRWLKHPDGKTFQKIEEEEELEGSCPVQEF